MLFESEESEVKAREKAGERRCALLCDREKVEAGDLYNS
jgi:hypothetical protein